MQLLIAASMRETPNTFEPEVHRQRSCPSVEIRSPRENISTERRSISPGLGIGLPTRRPARTRNWRQRGGIDTDRYPSFKCNLRGGPPAAWPMIMYCGSCAARIVECEREATAHHSWSLRFFGQPEAIGILHEVTGLHIAISFSTRPSAVGTR